jgi:hypothetical protein
MIELFASMNLLPWMLTFARAQSSVFDTPSTSRILDESADSPAVLDANGMPNPQL